MQASKTNSIHILIRDLYRIESMGTNLRVLDQAQGEILQGETSQVYPPLAQTWANLRYSFNLPTDKLSVSCIARKASVIFLCRKSNIDHHSLLTKICVPSLFLCL